MTKQGYVQFHTLAVGQAFQFYGHSSVWLKTRGSEARQAGTHKVETGIYMERLVLPRPTTVNEEGA
jgi:hypothetical protein